ncbi:hypothetical protein ACWEQL_06530 [Kitasatospora sp. NPDC004240]
MTVLHSRNADAADATDPDQATGREGANTTDLRDDLGRYAELGAFTLTAESHAWYAAVDTVATPEDARAASTALAELRGRDLQQVWEAVAALAADAKVAEPDTVAKAALLVELLQRVHRTSTTLVGAAYDTDLDALAAATADRAWRRERGVKVGFLRGRALRKQAAALVVGGRKARPEELHEALVSAEIERRAWAVLAPEGTLPVAPADGDLVERTAQAFEAINTGLRELARLLPEHDLDALPFAELADLVERLAADEGTLYRLPTIRTLRTTLEEAGLTDLLTELAEARADRRAAEAAYQRHTGAVDPDAARQALAGGQRDGLATAPAEVEPAAAETEELAEAAEADTAEEAEAPTTEPTTTVTLPAPSPAADDLVAAEESADEIAEEPAAEVEDVAAAEVAPVTEAEAEPTEEPAAEVAAAVEVEAEVAEEPVAEIEVAEPEAVVEVVEEPAAEAEAEAEVETESVEEPAAEVAPAVEVEVEAEAEVAEVEAEDAPAAEAEPVEELAAEVAAAVEVEEPAAEVVEESAAEVEDVAAAEVEPVTEAEPTEEPAAEVESEPVAEHAEEPAAEVEAEDAPAAEAAPVEEPAAEAAPAVEVEEPAAEPTEEPAAEVAAAVEVVEEPVAEAEVEVAEPEAVVEVVEEPVAEVEVEAEPEPVAEVVEEPAPAAEPAAPAAEGRPAKPDFTPGRPVTAYSAEELLAVVRWVDGDGETRSEEELLRAAMKELGFARLGPRIKEALGAAVTAARS